MSVRPPWWLKWANKVFIQISSLGMSFGGASGVGFMKRAGLVSDGRPDEFEALAGRIAVFRVDGTH